MNSLFLLTILTWLIENFKIRSAACNGWHRTRLSALRSHQAVQGDTIHRGCGRAHDWVSPSHRGCGAGP